MKWGLTPPYFLQDFICSFKSNLSQSAAPTAPKGEPRLEIQLSREETFSLDVSGKASQ